MPECRHKWLMIIHDGAAELSFSDRFQYPIFTLRYTIYMYPLVSVICLSYNHKPYIKEALQSIVSQSYKNIEIIVVDDASTDGSAEVIKAFANNHPHIIFIALSENVGNCKAFNIGWKHAKGDFIIDFALDDVLLPQRIENQINVFLTLPSTYGVVFSDVELIDAFSKKIGGHSKRDRKGNLLEKIPQGDVYKDLLERYFINPTSMIVRKEVFDALSGYDESLAYEDFDFWVRSSRVYRYHFIDEIQTLKRVLPYSHGSKFIQKRQYKMLESTLKVCGKAFYLNKTQEENAALVTRIRYHMRQALYTENFSLVKDFFKLLTQIRRPSLEDRLQLTLAKLNLPLFWIYQLTRK